MPANRASLTAELGMPITSKAFQYTRFSLPRKPLEVAPITLFPKPEANQYKVPALCCIRVPLTY